jgi:hypothetical protein
MSSARWWLGDGADAATGPTMLDIEWHTAGTTGLTLCVGRYAKLEADPLRTLAATALISSVSIKYCRTP